jgi:hypothetical protein
MTAVEMDAVLAHEWNDHYAGDVNTALVKLVLGHDAYERSINDSSSVVTQAFSRLLERARVDLNPKRISDNMESLINTQTSKITDLIKTSKDLGEVKSKLTSKGKVFEEDLVKALDDVGLAFVTRVTEKGADGKIGCDVMVASHSGMKMRIELKDTASVTSNDLDKFVRDVKAGRLGDSFAFLRKGGVGNSRLLAEKPEFEMIEGHPVFWFKGDEIKFVEDVHRILGLASQSLEFATRGNGSDERVAALENSLKRELEFVRDSIKKVEESTKNLKKRETALLRDLEGGGGKRVKNEIRTEL